MLIGYWIKYLFRIIIFSGVIISGMIGWKRKRNTGFILISGSLSLLYHLPSIYFKGYNAIQRYTPQEYGDLMIKYSYVNFIVMPVIAVLLVTGLFLIALKETKSDLPARSVLRSCCSININMPSYILPGVTCTG